MDEFVNIEDCPSLARLTHPVSSTLAGSMRIRISYHQAGQVGTVTEEAPVPSSDVGGRDGHGILVSRGGGGVGVVNWAKNRAMKERESTLR